MFNIIPSEEKDKNPKNPICATLSLMKILEIVQYIFTFWQERKQTFNPRTNF